MNIIKQVVIDHQSYTVAEIGSGDSGLLRQYWETRTSIWTYKYPEKADVDGMERDENDHSASFVVLIEGSGTVVAGTRLIHKETFAELPIADCARVQPAGPAVEVSRFYFSPTAGTEPQHAEQQFKLFIYGVVTFLKRQGYERAHATIRSSLFAKLSQLGVPMVRNGPEQTHGGKSFTPAMMFEVDQHFATQTQPDLQRLAA